MTANAVSIDRTSLSLGPLLISDDGSGTYSLTEQGIGRPSISARITYAGDSPWLHGSTPVSAVRDNSTLPLQVLVQSDSSANLDAAIDALDAAVWQLTYSVTTAHDGKVWRCFPASWGIDGDNVLYARRSGFFEVLNLSLPCFPIPGA